MRRPGRIVATVLALYVIGCTSKDKAKKPSAIADILVEVDGKPAPPLTSERLAKLEPDYKDGAKRGWKLTRLFPKALASPPRVVESVGAGKARRKLRNAASPVNGTVVALVVGVGEPFVARIDPKAPFAARPERQVEHIVRLRIYSPRRGRSRKPAAVTSKFELKIQLDGKAHATWTFADLNKVATHGRARQWSLRDVAKQIAAKARITELVTGKGNTHSLPAKAWADAKRVPLFKLNRRGQLKFWWSDARGRGIRDIVLLRAVTK